MPGRVTGDALVAWETAALLSPHAVVPRFVSYAEQIVFVGFVLLEVVVETVGWLAVGGCVVGIMGLGDDGRLVGQLVVGPGRVYVGLVGMELRRLLVVGNDGLVHPLDLRFPEFVERRGGRVLRPVVRVGGRVEGDGRVGVVVGDSLFDGGGLSALLPVLVHLRSLR